MPVMEMEKEKIASTVEDEILKQADKIQKNRQEDDIFSKKLDDLLGGKLPSGEVLSLGKTPNVLRLIGSKSETLTINQSVVKNCMNDENIISHGHTSGHALSLEIMKQLPEAIRNPIMICNGSKDGTVVAITEIKNRDNKNVIIPIAIDVRGKNGLVSSILSAYGKDNIQKIIDKGIIAQNTKKASELFTVIEANSSQATSIPCFDNSIAYTTANVKYPEGKNAEISQFHGPVTHDQLIPILNAKANWQEGKLNTLKEKRERQTSKIEQYQSKIDKLTYKAERLEDTNKFLKNLGEKIPAVKALIERNERKIKAIREDKIPARQIKIQNCKNKISEIDRKSEIRSHKLERCVALSDTVKSFALIGKERRTKFANAMDRLNKSTFNCLCDKRQNVISKQEKVIKEMQLDFKMIGLSQLSAEEKAAKINEVTDKFKSTLEKLDKKISKLKLPENYYGYTPENQLDKLIDNTQKVISESVEKGEVSVAKISEKVCEDNSKLAFELSAEKENPLRNAELAMEENGNMIDGVINNLPAEKSEISDTYVDRITNAVWEKLQGQLKEKNIEYNSVNDKQNSVTVAVNNASKNSFKSEKNKAVENQVAEYLNPEYYKKIAKEDRFTQVMTEEQAREKLAELKADGIEYSAVIKGDKSKVTINQKDFRKSGFSVTKLNEKIAEKTKSEERPQQKNHSRDEQSL